jgi:glyoxylase-like metal-dependent hydrolase (beta-lactamase superfamily II)
MSVEIIKDYIHARLDFEGANVTCINTEQGLVLVDTPMLPWQIAQWKEFVLGLNSLGIQYIINTDHHFDHVLGNNQLEAPVIMQRTARDEMLTPGRTLREEMVSDAVGWPKEEMDFVLGETLVPARIAFEEDLWLHMGNCTMRLVHTSGHTGGTLCVYLVEDRVLIPGDSVQTGQHPYKGQAIFADWLTTLEMLQKLDVDIIVPGHGEVCRRDAIEKMHTYFQKLWDSVAERHKEGTPKDRVIEEVHAKMIGYYDVDPEAREWVEATFDLGTARLYDEIARMPSG